MTTNVELRDEDTVTIPKEDYEELQRRDNFLSALEQAGVDNWSGHSHAWEIFEAQTAEEL